MKEKQRYFQTNTQTRDLINSKFTVNLILKQICQGEGKNNLIEKLKRASLGIKLKEKKQWKGLKCR